MTTATHVTRRGIVAEATSRVTRGAAPLLGRWLLLAMLLPLPALAEVEAAVEAAIGVLDAAVVQETVIIPAPHADLSAKLR